MRAASSGAFVELFINGVSKGKKKVKKNLALFDTTYTPGTIEAVSYDKSGREIGRDKLISAKAETMIRAEADKPILKADGDDITFVEISLCDQNGIVKPLDRRIKATLQGPGELLAIGSGNPRVTDSYLNDSFEAYNGRLACVIRSLEGQQGAICLSLTSPELEEAKLIIKAE